MHVSSVAVHTQNSVDEKMNGKFCSVFFFHVFVFFLCQVRAAYVHITFYNFCLLDDDTHMWRATNEYAWQCLKPHLNVCRENGHRFDVCCTMWLSSYSVFFFFFAFLFLDKSEILSRDFESHGFGCQNVSGCRGVEFLFVLFVYWCIST